jgi:hypothetical protein
VRELVMETGETWVRWYVSLIPQLIPKAFWSFPIADLAQCTAFFLTLFLSSTAPYIAPAWSSFGFSVTLVSMLLQALVSNVYHGWLLDCFPPLRSQLKWYLRGLLSMLFNQDISQLLCHITWLVFFMVLFITSWHFLGYIFVSSYYLFSSFGM